MIGCLAWLGARLDAIVIVNVVMSVGFSVDQTAHVCYHYYRHTCTMDPSIVPKDGGKEEGRLES
ncbi:MAG: hypothetical protein GY738_31215, partial [Pseudoalteromonas sp.]|nr:hypothetical protein [Pseudoalteromonas sp.]